MGGYDRFLQKISPMLTEVGDTMRRSGMAGICCDGVQRSSILGL
jgi:hypothetical protein